jgi:hypothetical protein
MTLVAERPSPENRSHKVAAEIHCYPQLIKSEIERHHLLNQQTTSTMATQASTMPHAPHSHAPGIHQQHGDTSFAQQASPSKRSKSIKIKRGRGSDDFASSSVSASAEQMYDWATWRMYHRITSARRNRSAVMPLSDVPDPSMNSRTYRGFVGCPLEATGDYTVHGGLATRDEGSDEGVFVMDL